MPFRTTFERRNPTRLTDMRALSALLRTPRARQSDTIGRPRLLFRTRTRRRSGRRQVIGSGAGTGPGRGPGWGPGSGRGSPGWGSGSGCGGAGGTGSGPPGPGTGPGKGPGCGPGPGPGVGVGLGGTGSLGGVPMVASGRLRSRPGSGDGAGGPGGTGFVGSASCRSDEPSRVGGPTCTSLATTTPPHSVRREAKLPPSHGCPRRSLSYLVPQHRKAYVRAVRNRVRTSGSRVTGRRWRSAVALTRSAAASGVSRSSTARPMSSCRPAGPSS
ncbi:hypothetical protein J3A78_000128 [Streptomyces sp. PvR006]|nr:hypothetical protein [Streptomyces sp. PvR006]